MRISDWSSDVCSSDLGGGVERPADAVDHLAGAVLGGIDLPQLLDADAEGLGIDAFAQGEALEQRLGEGAAAALGEEGEPPVQLDPRGEIGRASCRERVCQYV